MSIGKISGVIQQKKCHDFIELDDKNVEEFLKSPDNIILTGSSVTHLYCFRISDIERYMNDESHLLYQCNPLDKDNVILRIPLGENIYIYLWDMKEALNHRDEWKFITFDDTGVLTRPLITIGAYRGSNHSTHCQEHTKQRLHSVLTYNVSSINIGNLKHRFQSSQNKETRIRQTNVQQIVPQSNQPTIVTVVRSHEEDHLEERRRNQEYRENQYRLRSSGSVENIRDPRNIHGANRFNDANEDIELEAINITESIVNNIHNVIHRQVEQIARNNAIYLDGDFDFRTVVDREYNIPLSQRTVVVYSELSQIDKDLFNTEGTSLTAKFISCANSGLLRLPNCPNAIVLICNENHLTHIPNLPNIVELNCKGNRLRSLPIMPTIMKLNCAHNSITELPTFPNIKILNCADNLLSIVPPMPNCVFLSCSYNIISSILNVRNIKLLDCQKNLLTQLPELRSVKLLDCARNLIVQLPNLPKVKVLFCNNNRITVQPQAPKLEYLCYLDNPLRTINVQLFPMLKVAY